jgi:hypothetical protein
MADTQMHSHGAAGTHVAHTAHRSDMGAAFAGLVIGVVALLLILGTIVVLTNRQYAAEKPAAGAER